MEKGMIPQILFHLNQNLSLNHNDWNKFGYFC